MRAALGLKIAAWLLSTLSIDGFSFVTLTTPEMWPGTSRTALSVSPDMMSNPEDPTPANNPSTYSPLKTGLDKMAPRQNDDPSIVEIDDSSRFQASVVDLPADIANGKEYPFALMMQGSAPYIAAHAEQTAVFHLPGELFYSDHATSILADIALARLLGMKIVLVVGCRYDADSCSLDFDNPAQCHNALKVTDRSTLRLLEEEAGFLRTEMERKLNRCMLGMHGGVSLPGVTGGNVVSGHFYTAQKFGLVNGQDFEHTGFTTSVQTPKIRKVLQNDDIVLLTTVGLSNMGELVNVNGYHLSASVAAALDAYKLVYFADEGSVLCERTTNGDRKLIQELPLSFAQAITDHYGVRVHRTGFAVFEESPLHVARGLKSRAVELLLHLAWASWAVEQGVTRAHIVNPTDGALLEELFTSKNGANTCLFHDDEFQLGASNADDSSSSIGDDWDLFFQAAARQGQQVAKFG